MDIPFLIVCVGVYWVVFVDDVDRFSLARELDMDSAAAIESQRRVFHGRIIAVAIFV